ncbi:putative Na+/H+ antiporter, membrane subunit [Corynebacterium glutamicum MB001]|uniref:Cation:proton antiporter n=2 Tax=Corynebacterium TaxID=1716 RepID=A0A0F6Z438_9CORY|nr:MULTISPECIES: Na+/H+ antiporter subunit G [Corynebacterium]AGT04275.1 putative Na+/H+ antiporter, membrane subunit [Corynebacterium glutamicum MB001]AIK83992.1 cation:proton antiporter [Corynebacterium glutamicum]AIK86754.1 cation:proton antiporter [Corynebacterium glutamicum]AJE66327.1 cation:proton antiporter [Corynebacterium glutamicum]AKF26328.1 cation:proton antiporter [[Brevibacterium] flavum]
MTIPEIIVSILVILAGLFSLGTAIALWRAPDPLTRANLLGTTVGVSIPLLIIALLIHTWSVDGFNPNNFIRAIIAIIGVWVIGSVGSYYMGRAIYGVTVVDNRRSK